MWKVRGEKEKKTGAIANAILSNRESKNIEYIGCLLKGGKFRLRHNPIQSKSLREIWVAKNY